jgi:signal transduction histidine kinase/tetratricopeptide (TPR) repeat protein
VYFVFHGQIECAGQNAKIDSLRKLTPKVTGKALVDLYNHLAFELGTVNNGQSKESARKALQLAEQIHYDKGIAEALVFDGITEFSVGHDRLARKLFNRSIAVSRRIGNTDLEGYGLTYLGLNYQNLDDLDSAHYCFERALVLLQNGGNRYYESFLYIVMADYYEIKGDPENQIPFLRKCWDIREKGKDKRVLSYVGVRIAAYHAAKGEYEMGLSYLKRSQDALGKDTVDNEEICVIRQERATIFARQGYYLRALKLFHEAKAYYEQNSFPLELTNLLSDTGDVFAELSNYETSLKNYFEGLKIAEANHYDYQRIKILLQIGWVYSSLEQYTLARQFVEKAIPEAKSRHHQKEESYAYNLMGIILVYQSHYDEARMYFDKALELRQKNNDQLGMAGALSNIGWLLEKQNNLAAALKYQHDALAIEEKLNHRIGIALSYELLGQLYTKAKNYTLAEEYLKKDEALAKKIKASSVLLSAYRYRRDLLIQQQRTQDALHYSILYENLKDSIYTKNLSSRVATLENVYELEKKQEEITILNKNQELQEKELAIEKARVRQQQLILGGVAGIVILFGVVAVLLYRNNRKIKSLNHEIKEQNEEIQAQSEELTESNVELNRINSELAMQKEEIAAQNEELIQSSEEVMAQRDLLATQNSKIEAARIIIEEQNNEIRLRNENLELEVEKRTKELLDYNQQLEQFAFVSSHNLRAPVARILGLGQLLELSGLDAADNQIIHNALIKSSKELDRVVRDLNSILDIKRNNTSELSEIEFAEELNLIKINIESEINITQAEINADFSKAPVIKTVRPYLDSILLNLISNSIKYRIPDTIPQITIRTEHRSEYICIIVSDNGLGLDVQKHREKIFTLYSRFHTHVEGKGLGLYLIKTQVAALGGKIEVDGEENRGMTFSVYLKNNKSIS